MSLLLMEMPAIASDLTGQHNDRLILTKFNMNLNATK